MRRSYLDDQGKSTIVLATFPAIYEPFEQVRAVISYPRSRKSGLKAKPRRGPPSRRHRLARPRQEHRRREAAAPPVTMERPSLRKDAEDRMPCYVISQRFVGELLTPRRTSHRRAVGYGSRSSSRRSSGVSSSSHP